MLIFRKEHNERHLHTVRGNIFKKNQRRGVFYRGHDAAGHGNRGHGAV